MKLVCGICATEIKGISEAECDEKMKEHNKIHLKYFKTSNYFQKLKFGEEVDKKVD